MIPAPLCCSPPGGAADWERLDPAGTAGVPSGGSLGKGSSVRDTRAKTAGFYGARGEVRPPALSAGEDQSFKSV